MRLTLWVGLVCFFSDHYCFCFHPRSSEKSLRGWNTPSPPIQGRNRIFDSHWGMFDFSDSLPAPLLFSTHICLSDYFWLSPTFVFPTTFDSLNSFAETSFLQDSCIRFPPIFVLHQSSLYTNHSLSTNLRLRISHTLVPHNLVYPELFFVPMSISTVVQIPIQSAILQSVTHIISQTDRCSSPCFFMGVSIIECRLNAT